MQPPVFYGSFDCAVDEKQRLLVPSEVRKRIDVETQGKDFFMVVGRNRRPWLYTINYYDFLARQEQQQIGPSRSVSDRDRFNYGMSQLVELDKQGRVLIPTRSFDWTGLEKNKPLTLVGVRDHLELWDRTAWEAERKALFERNTDPELPPTEQPG